MKNIFRTIFVSLVIIFSAKPDKYPRNYNIDILHYTFNLNLTDSSNSITGKTVIKIKFLNSGVKDFNLDLAQKESSSKYGMIVSEVEEDGKPVSFLQSDNKLMINLISSSEKDSIKNFSIKYSGIPEDGLIISKNKYGDRTFFGDNWPDRVHYWLPTIDHPYDKASCDFIITAPSYYQVIANGTLVEKTNLNNKTTLTHWKESEPIATYLMVIGVSKFAVQYMQPFIQKNKDVKCIPIETWVYPQDKEKGFYDFSPAKKIIELFTNLIGPFPYEKLANVESKTIYGGMENASNIFYSEHEVTGSRTSLVTVAHETAHQWFGDAVTENDWNHIWLSEGFATFFQNVFIEHEFGKDSLINSMKLERQQIINYDERNPESPVVDTTINDLVKLLNINSYQKGSWILRMLSHQIGEENFWKGIHLYYKTFMNKNALTKDFEKIMEDVSGKNLAWFFDEWIYKPGFPILKGNWRYNNNKITVTLAQIQTFNNSFKFPLEIGIFSNDETNPVIKTVHIEKIKNIFTLNFNVKPTNIILDPNTWLLMESNFEEE
ncbi:MAG: M1 family metallopeptidase [Bacteroidetes bacterium]|nr:M1 family metallopeptidase [Bacteroidota bacterium]